MSKIIGKRPPTEKTPGILGQEYIDSTTGKTYVCTHVNYGAVNDEPAGEIEGRYTWVEGSGGISDPKDIPDMYYEDEGKIFIIENFNMSDTYHHGMGNMKCPLDPVANFDNLEDGQKCYLDFNGVVYEGSFISSGNARVNFENVEFNGKTFPITVYTDEIAMSNAYMIDNSIWDTVTISAYIPGMVINHIKTKYIKDMYGEEPAEEYILKNFDLSVVYKDPMGTGSVEYEFEESINFDNLTEGQRCYLRLDGEEYFCTYEGITGHPEPEMIFSGVIWKDNWYDIYIDPSDNELIISGQSSEPSLWQGAKIDVYTKGVKINTIPEKYLPQPITFVVDESDNVTVPRPFEEIYTLAINGYMDFQLDQSVSVSGNLKRLRAIQTMTAGPSSLAIFFVDMAGGSPTIMLNSDGTAKVIYATE